MKNKKVIPEKKLAKLAKCVAKTFALQESEAMELIYDEWDLVETLFQKHKKVKAVYQHLIEDIDYNYRIA